MHYFIFSNKDATLYSDYQSQNTGKDEILEIYKIPYSASYSGIVSGTLLSRALVSFDLTKVSQSIVNGTIGTDARFYLNLYVCQASHQPETTSLYIYPISQSWRQGIGKRFDSIIREGGVSWIYRDYDANLQWASTGSAFINNEVIAQLWDDENQFQNSGHYTYELSDLRADVTSIVKEWLSGSYANNGFLIKRTGSQEEDSTDYGLLQFYSTDTHTIYNPKLEVAWDDSTFATGSLTQSTVSDLFVYVKQLQATYNNRDKSRFRIGSRPKYPTKSYVLANPYNVDWYLPSSSYYSIVDSQTEETFIPFDTSSTKLSCDSNGNYFDLWMNGFHPERYYRIKIKVVSGSFEQVFEMPTSFRVSR